MNRILVRTILVLALIAPAALAEEAQLIQPAAAADADAVRRLFQNPESFRVAQGATVPISVVHAGSFRDFDASFSLSPNTFGTVFAEIGGAGRLLPEVAPNVWGEEFVDGVAPTALDGVRVMVNGKPASIAFIGRAEDLGSSLDQINFLSPADDAMGPVSFEVFQGDTLVAASTVNLGTVSPGLFSFPGPVEEGLLVAALSGAGGFVAPVGHFGKALESAPIEAGGVIQVFASGFGATTPEAVPGTLAGSDPISTIAVEEITVAIGGIDAAVAFAGLTPNLAGLYQFNVIVPATLQAGNHPIVISRDGVASQDGMVLPVIPAP